MEIIPVIDIMHGLAVHAKEGRREHYRPLASPLCPSPEPRAVIEGLLGLYPFKTFYIADLDALMGKGRQTALLEELRHGFPGVEFWIDQGLPEREKAGWAAADNAVAVIGTESLAAETLPQLAEQRSRFILSLDFREGRLLGPEAVLDQAHLWPERVILMNLSHVGGTRGPDFAGTGEFARRFPERRFIAAGGVRSERDLERLEALGMAAVLVASALHAGAVDGRVLRRFA
jgi:phosphoribosylformimino-5-aminoimidazole carboxamide ribotide isomerase